MAIPVPAWRTNTKERPLDNSVLGFTTKVYQAVSKASGPDANLLLCPLSVQIILSLLTEGASGNTAKQMRQVLSVPQNFNATTDYFFTLMQEFQATNADPQLQLLIANRIYTRKNFRINKKFNEVAQEFQSDVVRLDFNKQTQAAKKINDWVSLRTKDKIHDLVSADDLSINTQLMLVNALYFDAKWHYTFDKANTTDLPFYTATKNYTVPMMRQKLRIKYADIGELNAYAIEIPYHNYEYAMSVIVPKRVDGLADLEALMDQVFETVQSYVLYTTDVDLEIPRFHTEATTDYTRILQQLGMVDAFSERADFKKLSENERRTISISQVVSKTLIDVTEDGTVAAAATAIAAVTLSIPIKIPEAVLTIDRPFMYIISSRKHSAPIFIGRYVHP
jgi:serpin B